MIRVLLDHPVYFFLVMSTALIAFSEIGIAFDRFGYSQDQSSARSFYTMIDGTVFAILGLMLGFTFAMAMTRFDARKQLVIQEADAISTAYLRTEILPETRRGAIDRLLRSYVAARLDFGRTGEPAQVAAALARAERLQRDLWEQAFEGARENNNALSALMLQSFNQMFDLEADRADVIQNRIPLSIWVLLAAVSAFACAMTGYLYPQRLSVATTMLPFVLAAVMGLIVDLDSPRAGLIRISQASMERVQVMLAAQDSPPELSDPHPPRPGPPSRDGR